MHLKCIALKGDIVLPCRSYYLYICGYFIHMQSLSYIHIYFSLYLQYRKLQFDFKTQTLWNIRADKDTELKGFKFTDIRALDRPKDNPLSFNIYFRSNIPYHMYPTLQCASHSRCFCALLDLICCECHFVQIGKGCHRQQQEFSC